MARDLKTQQTRIPNGSASAAVLAGGVGACVFGVTVVLAEANSAVAEWLNLVPSVGPLSGKVAVGIATWVVSWGVFQKLWGRNQINFGKVCWGAWALVFVGFVLTFPPLFQLFAD